MLCSVWHFNQCFYIYLYNLAYQPKVLGGWRLSFYLWPHWPSADFPSLWFLHPRFIFLLKCSPGSLPCWPHWNEEFVSVFLRLFLSKEQFGVCWRWEHSRCQSWYLSSGGALYDPWAHLCRCWWVYGLVLTEKRKLLCFLLFTLKRTSSFEADSHMHINSTQTHIETHPLPPEALTEGGGSCTRVGVFVVRVTL